MRRPLVSPLREGAAVGALMIQPDHANRGPLYRLGVSSTKRIGNWTPDGKVERAIAQREYRELTPAQRMEQVFELSRFMSQVADAGRRQRQRSG